MRIVPTSPGTITPARCRWAATRANAPPAHRRHSSSLPCGTPIGDALLFTHRTDPDFDPSQHAFYYVRVIEIPAPRWTAFDAKFFGIDMGGDSAMKLRERACTSPTRYVP